MSSDSYEEHSGDDRSRAVVTSLDRREYLKAIGALSAVGLIATGRASARGSESGNRRSRTNTLERHNLTNDGLGNAQTDTPPFMPRLKTYNDRQYYAYWTHAGELVVAARDLPVGEWEQNNTGIQIDERNGHWTPGVGIGPDGHVFLNYNTRDSEIR